MNEPLIADVEWNAGDLGCGPLLLELRNRLRTMPGQVFKLISVDPGSPEDLPVWCRLSRNELLHHDPETKSFWIRSRHMVPDKRRIIHGSRELTKLCAHRFDDQCFNLGC